MVELIWDGKYDADGKRTAPLRGLEERVASATRLGAVTYIPSGRGGEVEEAEEGDEQGSCLRSKPTGKARMFTSFGG